MIAALVSFKSPLATRPMTSTRSSSRLLMAVLFNQTSSGWRSQSKGTFLISSEGDIIIKFQQQKIPKEEDNRRGKVTKPNKYGDLAVSGFPFAREAQAGCNAPGERCERIAVGNSARFWLNRDIELFRRE